MTRGTVHWLKVAGREPGQSWRYAPGLVEQKAGCLSETTVRRAMESGPESCRPKKRSTGGHRAGSAVAGERSVRGQSAVEGSPDQQAARDLLLRRLTQPLQQLAVAVREQGNSTAAALSPLMLLDRLVSAGLVSNELASRYRDAYHAVRYAPAPPGTEAIAAVASEIEAALPAADVAARALAPRETAESPGPAERPYQPVRRPGWSSPPYQPRLPEPDGTPEAGARAAQWPDRTLVRRLLIGLVAFVLAAGWTGLVVAVTYRFHDSIARLVYRVKHGQWPRPRTDRVIQDLLDRVNDPEFSEEQRVRMMLELAHRFYDRGEWVMAEHFYRAALERRPNDPEIMNNLAWLLLTRGDRWFQDIKQGFRLAQRAAELKPAPHIRDTLAEAYYLMGEYEKAVRLEETVVRDDPSNAFYKEQLKKFRRALNQQRKQKQKKSTSGNGSARQPL